jgi:Domain of unknown function (DUF4426)
MFHLFYRRVLLALVAVISLTVISVAMISVANAEQKKSFGTYDVHYSVLNSTFISPETARHYGITRGKNRALINIAVRKRLDTGKTLPQQAKIRGSSSDLIRSVDLPFTEVKEKDAIYYLAELKFQHKEMRTFTIKVQPDPKIAAYTLKFSKTMYKDR